MKSILLVKKFLGLVEMTSALCQLQLARMASCKNDFLCTLKGHPGFQARLWPCSGQARLACWPRIPQIFYPKANPAIALVTLAFRLGFDPRPEAPDAGGLGLIL